MESLQKVAEEQKISIAVNRIWTSQPAAQLHLCKYLYEQEKKLWQK